MGRSSSNVTRGLLLVVLAFGSFGCDHATKTAARASLAGGGAIDVVHGALELRYVENTDIAFNAFARAGVAHSPALLAALACLGIVAAIGLAFAARAWTPRIGLALIVGGALGNVADRLRLGYVVDFIHVRGWPVFNVADVAVVAGMALLFLPRRKTVSSTA